MNAVVQKWGNSLALRIPKTLAKDIHLHQGSMVDIEISKGKIIVNPKKQHKYSLAQLLKKITKKNLHSEQDWGDPSGQEIW